MGLSGFLHLFMNQIETDILATLTTHGPVTSNELQVLSGKSQPTLSRALRALGGQIATLGRGRATRYGVPQPIQGQGAQQPLWWTDLHGNTERWGTLTMLAGGMVHVDAPGIDSLGRGQLPWFLSPLRLQGFLGREWGLRLGLAGDPERWPIEQVLYAALRTEDTTGAISIGERSSERMPAAPIDEPTRAAYYDALAADVGATLPAGSSAGGEQSKFLTTLASGEHVLVKFTPPRGTPFGERWHDLLHTEALALQVLAEHGAPVARTRIVESGRRTYLESTRFDRLGPRGLGRRHVVALDAVHAQFVTGARHSWPATCDALVLQRRLSPQDAAAVRALFAFGQAIGNTDMHFGNLSLWADDPAAGRFALAPLYDMLPMRWRPDGFHGLHDYSPFEPPTSASHGSGNDAAPTPRSIAAGFWQRAARHAPISRALRTVAGEMARRLGG
jgi:HipA-like C-terminal domain